MMFVLSHLYRLNWKVKYLEVSLTSVGVTTPVMGGFNGLYKNTHHLVHTSQSTLVLLGLLTSLPSI